MKRIPGQEVGIRGLLRLGHLVLSRSTSRVNAASLGWKGATVPLGSRVVGSRDISVGGGFFASGPVWIEAIRYYGQDTFSPKITIGSEFRASKGLHITAIGEVTIGSNCLFGSNVLVSDNAHGSYADGCDDPTSAPADRPLRTKGSVTIGDRCWLGDNVVVLSGVSIGDGCIVAANSVVTHSLDSNCIAAGSPARIVRRPFDRPHTN